MREVFRLDLKTSAALQGTFASLDVQCRGAVFCIMGSEGNLVDPFMRITVWMTTHSAFDRHSYSRS